MLNQTETLGYQKVIHAPTSKGFANQVSPATAPRNIAPHPSRSTPIPGHWFWQSSIQKAGCVRETQNSPILQTGKIDAMYLIGLTHFRANSGNTRFNIIVFFVNSGRIDINRKVVIGTLTA